MVPDDIPEYRSNSATETSELCESTLPERSMSLRALEVEGWGGGTSVSEYIILFSSLPASSGAYLQVDSVAVEKYHFVL